ncbi:MAG TPA: hypothetical protein VGS79_24085 [Puia sp.]|nr:hypothetical protein [Puia sp.]
MNTSSYVIENANLSETWIAALRKITNTGGMEITPLVVILTNFTETPHIRKALDENLTRHQLPSIQTVSETIFPQSLYEYANYNKAELYKKYTKNLPRIKSIDSSNANGTYFERLMMFDENEPVHQLDIIISSLTEGNVRRRSKLQASVFDPKRDHTNKAFQGFPCLQHVTFYKSENGGLVLNCFYALQYLYRRAYGNWLGLVNLGKFVARETGLEFVRLNCFIGVEHLDHLKKQEAKELLLTIDQLTQVRV